MLAERDYMALERLTEDLHRAGYGQAAYQIIHTQKRVTGVRAHQIARREDASDYIYVTEAVRDGKKGRVYWTQMPESEELLERLEESIGAAGETSDAQPEDGEGKSIKAEKKAFLWESHETVGGQLRQAAEAAYRVPELFLVDHLVYEQCLRTILILKEDGTEYLDESGYHCVHTEMMAKRECDSASARSCRYGNSLEEIGPEKLACETAAEAAAGLGGASVESGRYPVILKNTAMAEMLEAYLPAFYADQILNQRSALSDCEGKQAAAKLLSLREIPDLAQGRVHRTIDDEGNPVSEKYLIRKGLFETVLQNRETSSQMKRECTGNGFKESPQSDVGIGVTNVILESADGEGSSMEALKKSMGQGLLVTDVDGVFAGTDVMTGAFSLIVKGRKIADGKETGAFCQATIAGNFFDMLRQIRGIGEDHAATYPDCASVLAPSVYVGELTVSGR